MKRSGTSEADFRTAATKKACRQYRVARCFLLPEAELRRRLGQGSGLQVWLLRNCSLGRSIAFTEIFDYESITKIQGSLVPAIWPT